MGSIKRIFLLLLVLAGLNLFSFEYVLGLTDFWPLQGLYAVVTSLLNTMVLMTGIAIYLDRG